MDWSTIANIGFGVIGVGGVLTAIVIHFYSDKLEGGATRSKIIEMLEAQKEREESQSRANVKIVEALNGILSSLKRIEETQTRHEQENIKSHTALVERLETLRK